MADALRQVRRSARVADLFELRLDLIRGLRLAELISSSPLPVVAACRPVREGGGFAAGEAQRLEFLEAASLLGAAYVDVELSSGMRAIGAFLRRAETQVIVSAHVPVRGAADAERLYERLHLTGAGVVKLAYPADDAADLGPAVKFLARARADRRRAVCIATGEAGEASRVLYRRLGGWATYAAPETGEGSAPGQLRASEMRTLYRADRLTARTRVFGVVGHPLGQSRGVQVHNALFRRAECDAVYCRFPVKNLARFMRSVAPLLSGFSVTIPHKESVLAFLTRIDRRASAIGAVNTVLRCPGGWRGVNTDAPGALDAVESVVRVAGKVMLIIGAGGAARAIACEARRRGAHVVVANRTASRARRLAAELGLDAVPMDRIGRVAFDILVSATPVGMVPRTGASPVPRPVLRGVVFDAVFNPPMTRLLRDAAAAGLKVIPGTGMYVRQAAMQSALYVGVRPSLRVVRSLLDRALRS